MKNLYKLIIAAILIASLFTQCSLLGGDVETIYQYENTTSGPVTMHIFSREDKDKPSIKDETVVIQPGQMREMKYYARGGMLPLTLSSYSRNYDYIYIYSIDRRVYQTRFDWDDLYNINKYELIRSENYKVVYRFTFTDAFFENGEPVE